MDTTMLKHYAALEDQLLRLRDSFLTAAQEATDDPGQRAYRAGLSDGFNIALLLVRQVPSQITAAQVAEHEAKRQVWIIPADSWKPIGGDK